MFGVRTVLSKFLKGGTMIMLNFVPVKLNFILKDHKTKYNQTLPFHNKRVTKTPRFQYKEN